MNDWGVDEVALFIRTLSNGEHAVYGPSFVSNGVDGAKFLSLSSVKELAQIVPDLGARYAIWEALQECKEGNVPSIPNLLKKDRTLQARGVGATSSVPPSSTATSGG